MRTKPTDTTKRQQFQVSVTRKEFLKLPMQIRRRALKKQTDVYLLRNALDILALALTEHSHKWSAKERAAYEEAMS